MSGIPSSQYGGEIACFVVFFLECFINLITIPQVALTPSKFLALFVPKSSDKGSAEHDTDLTPLTRGFVPWYAVLLSAMTELRALIQYNIAALAVIQEALLFGDLLHLAGAVHLARLVGGYSSGNLIGVVITGKLSPSTMPRLEVLTVLIMLQNLHSHTVFLIPWRIYYLWLAYTYSVSGKMYPWFSS